MPSSTSRTPLGLPPILNPLAATCPVLVWSVVPARAGTALAPTGTDLLLLLLLMLVLVLLLLLIMLALILLILTLTLILMLPLMPRAANRLEQLGELCRQLVESMGPQPLVSALNTMLRPENLPNAQVPTPAPTWPRLAAS